ncbi:MAG: histidine phosphatase family protein [Cognaticolwellia sp.]
MTTQLYLARHGQTQWNKVQRFQGQLNSGLTEQGIQQAKNVAQQLENKQLDLIVCSTLERAVVSANICQQHLSTTVLRLDGLSERDLGDWQGQYIDDLKSDSDYQEIFHQYTALSPQGGESAQGCGERIYHTLKALAQTQQNKNVLVIFHGEALRCFLAKLGHSATDNAYDLFDNGCILQFCYHHEKQSFQHLA